jgi:hypothetical protein
VKPITFFLDDLVRSIKTHFLERILLHFFPLRQIYNHRFHYRKIYYSNRVRTSGSSFIFITFVKKKLMTIVTQTRITIKAWSIDMYTIKRPCPILVCDNYHSNKVIIFLPYKWTLMSYVYFSTSFWPIAIDLILPKERKKKGTTYMHIILIHSIYINNCMLYGQEKIDMLVYMHENRHTIIELG